jgi:hypothetical protein
MLLLAAGMLGIGLATGTAGVAHAAVTPDPGVFYEIWPPYVNPAHHKCLDVPGGTSAVGTHLQIFHCHGYASNGAPQLFEFIYVGVNNYFGYSDYWIVNKSSGLCLSVAIPHTLDVTQDLCTADSRVEWEIHPSAFDPNGLDLVNEAAGMCMAVTNNSGQDHTAVGLMPCYDSTVLTNEDQLLDWELG